MKIGIICKYEGKTTQFIPILKEDGDGDDLFVFNNQNEAEKYADTHILCKASEIIIINLITGTSYWYHR